MEPEQVVGYYTPPMSDGQIILVCVVVALSIIIPTALAWFDHRRDVRLAELKNKPKPSFWGGWV